MMTLAAWMAVALVLLVPAAAIGFGALRAHTRDALSLDDAVLASTRWPVRVLAASTAVAGMVGLAAVLPNTLPESWRAVAVGLAALTAAGPCAVYVSMVVHRPWLLAVPFGVLALEAAGGLAQLSAGGASLALGATLPLVGVLVRFAHPSIAKRAPGAAVLTAPADPPPHSRRP